MIMSFLINPIYIYIKLFSLPIKRNFEKIINEIYKHVKYKFVQLFIKQIEREFDIGIKYWDNARTAGCV